MNPVLWPWILFGVAALAAGALAALGRARQARIDALEVEKDTLKERFRAAEKRLEDKLREQRRRGDELGELRKRLEKTKKRAARAQGDQRGESQRIHELEEEIRVARADRKAALAELERMRAPGPSVRPPTPVAPVVSPAKAPAAEPAPADLEALRALVERAERAEKRSVTLDEELRKASREAARQHKRAASLDDAYAAQRGELEAKKDRLRAQQEELERLRAIRATLVAASDAPAEPNEVSHPEIPPST